MVYSRPDEHAVGHQADVGRGRQNRSGDRSAALNGTRVRGHGHRSRRHGIDAVAIQRSAGVRGRHHRPGRARRLRRGPRHGVERRAVPHDVDHRHRRTQRRRPLLRSHRRRRIHSRRQGPGNRCDIGVGPAMWPGTGLRFDRCGRAGEIVRRHPIDLDARRRATAVPHQRIQVQPDLVDRWPDQRVLQSVRGDRRRQDARGASVGGARGLLARRCRLRGVQHLGGPRHVVRDAAR